MLLAGASTLGVVVVVEVVGGVTRPAASAASAAATAWRIHIWLHRSGAAGTSSG